jgi:signal peptidase I
VTSTELDRPAAPAAPSTSRHWLRDAVLVMLVAVLIASAVRILVVQPYSVPSASMQPTLSVGDRILAYKPPVTLGEPARGMVVVFDDPSHWLPDPVGGTGVLARVRDALAFVGVVPSEHDRVLVKRVIAVGGDHLVCCSTAGQLVLNGRPLPETYLPAGARTDQVSFDVTVPPGRLFVMGDNRANSADSRFHLDEDSGTVPAANVRGQVVAVLWPTSNLSWLDTPSVFSDPVYSLPEPRTKPTR